MHRTLIDSVRPAHRKIGDVDNNPSLDWSSADPMPIRRQDLQAWVGVLQEESKAFIVRMCPETQLLVLAGFGKWFGACTCSVLDQAGIPPGWVIIGSKYASGRARESAKSRKRCLANWSA